MVLLNFSSAISFSLIYLIFYFLAYRLSLSLPYHDIIKINYCQETLPRMANFS